MTTADLPEQLAALNATLSNIEAVLDLGRMRKEQAALEEQASAPDLWDDPAKAQVVTSRLVSRSVTPRSPTPAVTVATYRSSIPGVIGPGGSGYARSITISG